MTSQELAAKAAYDTILERLSPEDRKDVQAYVAWQCSRNYQQGRTDGYNEHGYIARGHDMGQ